ncbi:MAG TPA: hypothetical protein VK666_13335 [Chryseolinea sp.]|nr:hypothetical protein [Chryseolinea sp.]
MELEELKSIWKSSETVFDRKDEAEIASMLTKRSVSIIDKLKRSVWFELSFTVLIGLALLGYALILPTGASKWTSVSLLIMFLLLIFSYIKKIITLNEFNPTKGNVRENLVALINTLSAYLNFYKRSYTVLYPLFFCLSLLFIGIERGTEKFLENLLKPTTIISLLAMGLVYYFASTRFANWYLNKLYGNHLVKLKGLLNDIHG